MKSNAFSWASVRFPLPRKHGDQPDIGQGTHNQDACRAGDIIEEQYFPLVRLQGAAPEPTIVTTMTTSHHSGTARTARLLADGLRAATLLSAAVVLIWLNGYGVPFAVLFLILLAPRLLDVAAPFDAAFAATMLTATWARQQHWYVNVSWVDEAVHAVTPGATAAAVYLMLAKLDLLPDVRELTDATRRFSLVLLVTFVGLGLATIWEFFEWVENQYSPQSTHVGYNDTISDLALGGMGSVIAGALIVFWFHRHPSPRQAD